MPATPTSSKRFELQRPGYSPGTHIPYVVWDALKREYLTFKSDGRAIKACVKLNEWWELCKTVDATDYPPYNLRHHMLGILPAKENPWTSAPSHSS